MRRRAPTESLVSSLDVYLARLSPCGGSPLRDLFVHSENSADDRGLHAMPPLRLVRASIHFICLRAIVFLFAGPPQLDSKLYQVIKLETDRKKEKERRKE